jgi:transposase-like protein
MTSLENKELVTVNARGRVQTPREVREKILEEYEGSGMSARQYARVTGIREKTFCNWVRKRRRGVAGEVSAVRKQGVTLLEAVVEERGFEVSGSQQSVVLEFAGVARVEICLRGQLPLVAELVDLIAQRKAKGKGAC